MKRMNPFIEGSEKNGSGPPAGKPSKNLCFIDKNDMFVIESINFCQFGNWLCENCDNEESTSNQLHGISSNVLE